MTEGTDGSIMERPIRLDSKNTYEIKVAGEIDVSWLAGFDEVDVQTEIAAGGAHQSTLAKIVADQAGLVGLIRRLHGLGVVLVFVRQAPEIAKST